MVRFVSLLLLPPPSSTTTHSHNHDHTTTHNTTQQHTSRRDRHRDRETKPKYNERFAHQKLSVMFGKKTPLTFHNGFMFFFFFANISYEYFHVIVNRQGRHNIRNVVQTGHSTCTCTVTLCVVDLWTRKSRSNLLLNSKNHRNRSNWFLCAW